MAVPMGERQESNPSHGWEGGKNRKKCSLSELSLCLLLVNNKEETKKSDNERTSAAAVLVPHLTFGRLSWAQQTDGGRTSRLAKLSMTGLYSHLI